ncbi:MAG: ATPase [Cyclobacteriaceae bacterium]|nr:ATPase [Cyclobacteriaceae bacterium]MCH8517913.1 ATPase [Cyclobacteriaceae bacterium]
MKEKYKFTAEYEINAPRKVIFPYLSTASGLSEWFADEVNIDKNKIFHFYWDDEDHPARCSSMRLNQMIRFTFLDDKVNTDALSTSDSINDEEVENDRKLSYFELSLEESELTQTLFLRVIDYSYNSDEEDLQSIWDNLIEQLKSIFAG